MLIKKTILKKIYLRNPWNIPYIHCVVDYRKRQEETGKKSKQDAIVQGGSVVSIHET